MQTPIIDTHAHLVPPELVATLRRDGARYGVEFSGDETAMRVQLAGGKVKPFPKFLMRTEERIVAMDRQGVDMQVIAGWIDFSGYTMPLDLGLKFSELQNEMLAATVASNPDRYAGAANVPLQDTAAAIHVLERAVNEQGFKAIQVSTYVGPGRFLDDAVLDPFWKAVEEMKVLVLFHPYDEQPPQGLNEFFLHNCIGYPLQTTIAVLRMIFSGVFTRFPNLMVRLPHAGGFLPFQFDRFRHAANHRPEPRAKGFAGDPLDVLKTLYFDTLCYEPAPLRFLADLVGADRLMLGSDYPFEMSDADPVRTVKEAVPAEKQEAVLGKTVQRILCLSPACGCNGRPLRPLAEAV